MYNFYVLKSHQSNHVYFDIYIYFVYFGQDSWNPGFNPFLVLSIDL